MPGIGGNKLFIIEESDNQKNGVWVDFGKDFGKSRPFPQRAASATGIWTQLERGQIPLVPGNYDMWYILRTVIGNMGVIQDPEHVVASYLRAEVIAREMEEELTQLMGWQQVQLLLELGKKDIEKWYGGKSKRVESAIFTHPHADHIGDAPYLDRDQEWFGLEEMFAHMKAVTARAGAWDSGYEFVSRTYEKRRGGAYERSYRNWSPVGKSGELMNVSPGLVAEMGLVNHSIGGAGMVGISTIGGKPLMLATGDYKMGEMTMRTAERLAGKYPLIVTESTNALRWEKPSQNVSVEMVERTMFDLVGRFDGQGLTIITPPNHLERLEIILDVAEKTGRKVALGPEMAEVVHQLFVARENLVADASEGFNQRLPIIGEDVGLWWRPITSPRKYNKLLKSVAEQRSLGVVDSGRLSQESGDWIVVETPYRTLGDSFAQVYFPNGMQVLHSSYYPYENDMQRMVMDNTNWLRERVGGHYHTDFMVSGAMGRRVGLGHNYQVGFPGEYGLHSSGHASFEEAFGILTTLTNGWQAGQKLALIHGEHPMSYYRSLVDKIAGMGGHQPEVVWQMNRYDVASRKLGGHVIRLGE